ncbi:MAG: hypothetical protein LBO06_01260 [Bacteroidales bacterium]|jgi:phosphoribosyl-ATP pyrophosphohydrolase|nr:hypothetical protein [Bacteroidales bacterium]
MMQHKELSEGKWERMSFCEQMGNIGSEVSRTLKWVGKGNYDVARKPFERALELIDLTIKHSTRYSITKEVCRLRECLCEAYLNSNVKDISEINNYLYHFAVAVQLKK